MANELIEDGADIHIYDPKVSESKIKSDLSYLWNLNGVRETQISKKLEQVFVHKKVEDALNNSHAIAVLTEWDEFKNYNWKNIYDNMYKPAFLFDGRNILDIEKLTGIGFQMNSIGKKLV